MTTIELMAKLDRCQGGTIHQYAKEYECSVSSILAVSKEKIEYINNMLETSKDVEKFLAIAKKYYKRDVSINDTCKMLLKIETNREHI
jgi:hypothetical protein